MITADTLREIKQAYDKFCDGGYSALVQCVDAAVGGRDSAEFWASSLDEVDGVNKFCGEAGLTAVVTPSDHSGWDVTISGWTTPEAE